MVFGKYFSIGFAESPPPLKGSRRQEVVSKVSLLRGGERREGERAVERRGYKSCQKDVVSKPMFSRKFLLSTFPNHNTSSLLSSHLQEAQFFAD
jgi:hypothetical protein